MNKNQEVKGNKIQRDPLQIHSITNNITLRIKRDKDLHRMSSHLRVSVLQSLALICRDIDFQPVFCAGKDREAC